MSEIKLKMDNSKEQPMEAELTCYPAKCEDCGSVLKDWEIKEGTGQCDNCFNPFNRENK